MNDFKATNCLIQFIELDVCVHVSPAIVYIELETIWINPLMHFLSKYRNFVYKRG